MQPSGLLFALVALIFAVHSGHSMQCYQCYSDTDPNCLDVKGMVPTECTVESYLKNFKQFFKESPPQVLTSMSSEDSAKIRDLFTCLKFEINSGRQKVVLRSCEVGKILKTCDLMGNLYHGIEGITCNGCDTDGCNSSSVPIPSVLYTLLVTIGAFALTTLRTNL